MIQGRDARATIKRQNLILARLALQPLESFSEHRYLFATVDSGMRECPTCGCCLSDDASHCPNDGTATNWLITGEPVLDSRYQLERRLGSGGMGLVFKARHVFLKTLHAIKIILPDLVGNDPHLGPRFRAEARAAAAIRHQNVISVTDFGITAASMPFLVMEFVQGKSLQEIMTDEAAMPLQRAMEIMEPICAGMAAA